MNRRTFLRLLGLAGAGVALAPELVLDPERALWVPGQKTIFDLGARAPELFDLTAIPARGGNTFLTIQAITQEAFRILENNLAFTKIFNRQYDQQPFTRVNVTRPARFS